MRRSLLGVGAVAGRGVNAVVKLMRWVLPDTLDVMPWHWRTLLVSGNVRYLISGYWYQQMAGQG